MTDNGWRAQAAGEGVLQSPLSVASYIAYSSDGDAGGANGLGATGSRSSAMRELRERIQRERQQLHELERQLSHRKPIATTIRPSPAPGSVGTLRISPSSPQARSSKSSPDASNEKDAFRSGGGGMQRGSDKLHTPGGAPAPGQSPVRRPGRQMQENLFPSREVALQSSSIASMQDTLISLEAEHGRFRGTIAWLKDSVAKLEMAQQSEKDKHLGALGQADKFIIHEETREAMQQLGAQLHRVEEEQRVQASKMLELDRTLDACRLDVGDLRQMLAHPAAAQRHDARLASEAAQPQGGADRTEECAGHAGEEAEAGRQRSPRLPASSRASGLPACEDGGLEGFRASSPISIKGKDRQGSPESPVGRGGVSPGLLVFGLSLVPLALMVIKQNRAALEEWARQVQVTAARWRP